VLPISKVSPNAERVKAISPLVNRLIRLIKNRIALSARRPPLSAFGDS